MPELRRIRCRTSYDGTTFHGWQVQPGQPTIQAELQRVLSEIEEAPVIVDASGRTDAGVHALRQMIAFSLRNPIPCENLRRAINRLLPHTIRVFEVEETNAGFHPRFDAVAKHYQYRIWREEVCPPFDRPFVQHHPYPLDEAVMAEAASALEGEHDFTAFASADVKDALGYSKVRKVFRSTITREGPRLLYDVEGNGFLKHMVRNLIGTIVEVGKGNLAMEDFKNLLHSPTGIANEAVADTHAAPYRAATVRERPSRVIEASLPSSRQRHARAPKAGPSLPAQGLFLIDVRYRCNADPTRP